MPVSTVRVVFTKWGSRKHWEFDATRLGEDAYGVWLGLAVGCEVTRPGASFRWERRSAMLIPADKPWTAHFLTPATGPTMNDYRVYVDITTPPVWRGNVVTMVDLDLDVVVRADGTVFVDDEDEFAEHAVRWQYPVDVVSLAERSCAAALAAVAGGDEPFGSVGAEWLARATQQAG